MPSIVFLDDMDKFANGDALHPDAEEYVTVQSCIDEVKNKDVFVIATANSLRCLPDSLLRSGRFDRRIPVPVPSDEDAEQIIKFYLSGRGMSLVLDTKVITKMMQGSSCAELETVINEAGILAGYERADRVTMQHFMKAAMKIVFEVPYSELNCSDAFDKNPELLKKIACHEAGHTVVHEVLVPGSVVLATVYCDGRHHGGLTKFHTDRVAQDPYTAIKMRIIANLAGKAATEQLLGCFDVGTSEDLKNAHDMIMDLISDSAACGFALYGDCYPKSDALLYRQEQTVAAEVEKYYLKAKEIIAKNHTFCEAVADALMKKKLLSCYDIREIRSRYEIIGVRI